MIAPYRLFVECKATFGKREFRSDWKTVLCLFHVNDISSSLDVGYLNARRLLNLLYGTDSLAFVDYLKELAGHWRLDDLGNYYFQR
jgi:hypothetical protein